MSSVTSPVNSNNGGETTDSVFLPSASSGRHKKAVVGSEVAISSVSDTGSLDQHVGTHINAGTLLSTDSISLAAGYADDTSPASVTEAQVGYLRMTLSHLLKVVSTCDVATLSNVASAATSATIIAANDARIGLVIVNDDANILYIKYGATASTTSYTYQIPGGGGVFEMPFPVYRGLIDGIWSADGSGSARVTQLT